MSHANTNVSGNGHAYEHLVGKVIGVKVGEFPGGSAMVAAATVTKPEIGQDDNLVMIHIHGLEFNYANVRFMDTYRADFVNVKRDWVRVIDPKHIAPTAGFEGS